MTPTERVQRLNEQHRLVHAALDYLSGLVKAESVESGAHFERMRTEARTHFEQGKLAVLQKYFRDVAAPSLVHDGTAFAAYIQQTTGLTVNVQSDFEKRIARVCKRKRIRTDAEFYDVRDMIDSVDPEDEQQQAQLQLLYDLVAEYEGFLDVKDVGKPRPAKKKWQSTSKEVLRLVSPDGRAVLTVTESVYEDEATWPPRTQLMLLNPENDSGSGIYHANQVNADITAQWDSNTRLVVDVGRSDFNEQYPLRSEHGPMNNRIEVELLTLPQNPG
ncbi:hypothetical protein Q5H92_10720 [Hymenobacter sp. M29]|uniref:Uncharacterized protein n=1 Tax=Hymenobacter mellowenesis TaxID=3063995 RepID=A0ABT9ACW7_9BACT|nr:hypothetical protein [Hymenobacter sp. M29]MDO7846831.1 hypothetical protein [Hymenobacter sp. M29]